MIDKLLYWLGIKKHNYSKGKCIFCGIDIVMPYSTMLSLRDSKKTFHCKNGHANRIL